MNHKQNIDQVYPLLKLQVNTCCNYNLKHKTFKINKIILYNKPQIKQYKMHFLKIILIQKTKIRKSLKDHQQEKCQESKVLLTQKAKD